MKDNSGRAAGFTLVELMLVIAVIAILALVLIPKAAFMKQSAKDAGVETNLRVVEAVAARYLVGFSPSQQGIADFDQLMVEKLMDGAWTIDPDLGTATPPENSHLRNPFTQSETIGFPLVMTGDPKTYGSPFSNDSQCGFAAYAYADDEGPWTADYPQHSGLPGGPAPGLRGLIIWNAYVSEGAINCDIWGYDGDGRRSAVRQVN